MLKKGDKLPVITLEDHTGKKVHFHEFIGRPLVIFFYPKDNTKVCTAQACGFRDYHEAFADMDAKVIGVSSDSVKSHAKVVAKRNLPFPLLSDPNGKALKAFKVPTYLFGMLSARCTFIINSDGSIHDSFREDMNATIHIKKSLKMLQKTSLSSFQNQ